METHDPFDDLYNVIISLGEPAKISEQQAPETVFQKYPSSLTDLQRWLSVLQKTSSPRISEVHICIFASTYDANGIESSKKFIADAAAGDATVNRLCADIGIGLRVLEMAPELPHDLTNPWSETECMAAVAFGMEATAAGGQVLGLSSCAPGSQAAASVLIDKLAGEKCSDRNWRDILELMRVHGGREIAAFIGAIVAAKSKALPVILDCPAGIAAVTLLEAINSGVTDHVLVGACADDAARKYASKVDKTPLLGLSIDNGPGCGAAVTASVLRACCDV